jgi:type II secretory pathway predicted ATPase ExeA
MHEEDDVRKKLVRYGFRHLPFTEESREIYLDDSRTNNIKKFREFLQFRGFAVLSGPPGTGKSALLRHICDSLPANTHKTIYIPFSMLSDSDMLKAVSFQLGIDKGMSKGRMFKCIQKHVEEMQPANLVIVFDEVHRMPHQTLEAIRIMTNFYFEDKNYISIIMLSILKLY